MSATVAQRQVSALFPLQGMLEGVSQTQPVSPHIVEHLQESDDEGEGTGFGIVSLPTSRDAKRPKLEVRQQHLLRAVHTHVHFWSKSLPRTENKG